MVKSIARLRRQMERRGWTDQQIEEAKAAGPVQLRINYETGGPATRYIHPATGRSVIIDDQTGRVLHVGKDGDLYD